MLVHGSSVSGRPSFDLSAPGLGEYSVMNVFASAGFDTWAIDCEGYGHSTHTEGNSDIRTGVQDLLAAMPVLERETGQRRYHFYGESSGALRVGALAMVAPERLERLALGAFTFTGKGSPTLAARSKNVEYYRSHNRRPRDEAMIRSIFTRDQPGTGDPAVDVYKRQAQYHASAGRRDRGQHRAHRTAGARGAGTARGPGRRCSCRRYRSGC